MSRILSPHVATELTRTRFLLCVPRCRPVRHQKDAYVFIPMLLSAVDHISRLKDSIKPFDHSVQWSCSDYICCINCCFIATSGVLVSSLSFASQCCLWVVVVSSFSSSPSYLRSYTEMSFPSCSSYSLPALLLLIQLWYRLSVFLSLTSFWSCFPLGSPHFTITSAINHNSTSDISKMPF